MSRKDPNTNPEYMTATQVFDEFSVAKRTFYAKLKKLSDAGTPVPSTEWRSRVYYPRSEMRRLFGPPAELAASEEL